MLSYQVIARKWRSKTFQELVGQEHITTTLLNALKNERLAHAMLFTGPRGTGKTSSARILAKSLRCPEAKDFTPCGVCSSCLEINDGRSIDVIEIDGASNNGVDSVRDLREGVAIMPSTGKYKVYIIDEVHMLSTSAFNALLKTLEEPPAHVFFILATTELQKIPNTVLSRCQRFDFRRIPTRQIADHLSHICQEEKIPFDEESIWLIARQGDGSMRDSQSLLDQVITFCNGELKNEQVIKVLGLTDRGLLNSATAALIDRDKGTIIEITQNVLNSGYDTKIFLNELLEQLRNLMMIKVHPQGANVDLPDTEIENLRKLAERASEEDVHYLFDMALKGANDITRMFNPALAFEMVLLRMVSAPSLQNIANIFSGGATLPPSSAQPTAPQTHRAQTTPARSAPAAPAANNTPRSAPAPQSQPARQAAAPAAAAPVASSGPIAPESENWLKIVAAIKGLDGKTGATLENLALVEIDKEHLKLSLPAKLKFLEKQVMNPEFTTKLKDYVAQIVGSKLKVAIQLAQGERREVKSARKMKNEAEKKEQQEVEDSVRNHPLIQTTTKMFNGDIREIKDTQ